MPEYVSKAVRENIFSLPHYKIKKSYNDSLLPALFDLPLHEARKPCVDTSHVESPFGYQHIEREKLSMPHDEAQINRDVVSKLGLPRFPFPSYS